MIKIYGFFKEPTYEWYHEEMPTYMVDKFVDENVEVHTMISQHNDVSKLVVETLDDDVNEVAKRHGINLYQKN